MTKLWHPPKESGKIEDKTPHTQPVLHRRKKIIHKYELKKGLWANGHRKGGWWVLQIWPIRGIRVSRYPQHPNAFHACHFIQGLLHTHRNWNTEVWAWTKHPDQYEHLLCPQSLWSKELWSMLLAAALPCPSTAFRKGIPKMQQTALAL